MGEILQILECLSMLVLVLSNMLLGWMLPRRSSTNIPRRSSTNINYYVNVGHADHVVVGMENSYTTSSSSSSQAPQNHAGHEDAGPLQENDDEEQFTPE